jgi:hypothetical protein
LAVRRCFLYGVSSTKERLMHYDPTDIRPYPARIATNIGWVRGALSLPGEISILELLNGHDGLLRVTGAWLPSRRERIEFFAVRVGSISLVLPGDHTGDQTAAVAAARHRMANPMPMRRVLLLLDKISVVGSVALGQRARVSDVFAAGRSFVRIEGATISADRGGGNADHLDTVPELFVNVARVHGIADLDGELDPISQTVIPASAESLAAIGKRVVPPRRKTDPGLAVPQSPSPSARTSGGYFGSVPVRGAPDRRAAPSPEPTLANDADAPFRRG